MADERALPPPGPRPLLGGFGRAVLFLLPAAVLLGALVVYQSTPVPGPPSPTSCGSWDGGWSRAGPRPPATPPTSG